MVKSTPGLVWTAWNDSHASINSICQKSPLNWSTQFPVLNAKLPYWLVDGQHSNNQRLQGPFLLQVFLRLWHKQVTTFFLFSARWNYPPQPWKIYVIAWINCLFPHNCSRIFLRTYGCIYGNVPGLAIDCPCRVWGHGLTICFLYVSLPFENLVPNSIGLPAWHYGDFLVVWLRSRSQLIAKPGNKTVHLRDLTHIMFAYMCIYMIPLDDNTLLSFAFLLIFTK